MAPALTARDREVFGHLTEGRSQRQISVAMSISINTVRDRIGRLLRSTSPLVMTTSSRSQR